MYVHSFKGNTFTSFSWSLDVITECTAGDKTCLHLSFSLCKQNGQKFNKFCTNFFLKNFLFLLSVFVFCCLEISAASYVVLACLNCLVIPNSLAYKKVTVINFHAVYSLCLSRQCLKVFCFFFNLFCKQYQV